MAAVKIVVIGASRVFAPTIVADLWHARDDLAGSTVALCDLDADTLNVTTRVIQRMVAERDMPYRIESSTDRRDLLDGADYVIVAIALDHRRLWTIDLEIAEKHGMVLTTGDSVGPGGWSRALRTVPVFQAIAQDMDDLCPDAWLFNYTNPMCAICRTLDKTSDLKVVGLCHGIEGTTRRLAQVLDLPQHDLSARAAGINHLQWILDLRRNGTDVYPELKAAGRPPPSQRLDVSWDLMELYGFFPSPGDRHVSEFFPWYCRPEQRRQAAARAVPLRHGRVLRPRDRGSAAVYGDCRRIGPAARLAVQSHERKGPQADRGAGGGTRRQLPRQHSE